MWPAASALATSALTTVLPIFPERGLDQSILIAVLLGVYVLLFFTEMFGWVWAGLVVPGYLASVFVVQPAAGIAVVAEGIVTFVIVRFISDNMAKFGVWSPLIGRERFFVVVLVSVVVRQISELWLLETSLGYIDGLLGTHLGASHDFSSVGLVLVPLLANTFWKLDVRRGVFQTGVAVLIVYGVLQLVILPGTNLSFSNLELTYENVALDFLGSPKAYIILVTGSYLAAQYNLDYGWDYNGILVPSLLALTWFEPMTLVTTIIEALILLYATKAVLAFPAFKNLNLEGPRKVTVVFTVGFVLKFLLAWGLWLVAPDFGVTQLFGFGYVLTSLLAVKMLNLKKVGRVMLPAVQVSLVSFLAGSAVGFVLEQIAPQPITAPEGQASVASTRALVDPEAALAWGAVRAVRELPQPLRQGRPARELVAYAKLWQAIDAWLDGEGTKGTVEERALAAGLALRPVGGGWLLYDPQEDLTKVSGWDTALLFPGANGPVIEVPRPRTDAWAVPLAWALCERVQCRAVVVSGVDSDDPSSAAMALAHPRATLLVAHRELRRQSVVQLRTGDGPATLYLRHSIPARVSPKALWPAPLALQWTPPAGPLTQWNEAAEFAVLRVSTADAIALLTSHGDAVATELSPLREWLATWHAEAPEVLLSASELRVVEKMIAEPLLDGVSPVAVQSLARALGYHLAWLYDMGAADVVLGMRGHFAAAVMRPGGQPLVLEVPKGFGERGAAATALMLWRQAPARGLLMARATHALPWQADVATGVYSEYQALHQAFDRTLPAAEGSKQALIAAVRGLPPTHGAAAQALTYVGFGTPTLTSTSVSAAAAHWLTTEVSPLLGPVAYASSDADSRDLLGVGSAQLAFSRALPRVAVMQLWLSTPVRTHMRGDDEATWQSIAARAGVSLRRMSLYYDAGLVPRVAGGGVAGGGVAGGGVAGGSGRALPPSALDPAVVAAAAHYERTRDVASFSALLASAKAHGDGLVWDAADGVPWLVVAGKRWYPLMGGRTCAADVAPLQLVARRCAFELVGAGRRGP